MKRIAFLATLLLALCCTACNKYEYETVAGDPLGTRIYTLDNGLKVYLSINRETPRIQTYIAVKVGGKNDPAETTGLAHYFEHLMFKGTARYGTMDYAAEKPLLDHIEALFETYRNTRDEGRRQALYRRIDSLSYEASKLAIPNEYDKLMSAIGAEGSNAYTTHDMTVYEENIPSNQIENWAKIQAERFREPVIRGFHTELETIYEEKNMSLTNDSRKVLEAVDAALFPHHPYGRQTVLGTQESLKNPSITNVKNYHATYYVPNNMAICLSGDLDPDETIVAIDRHFGSMEPNPHLPTLHYEPEQPLTAPVVREVYGTDAENVIIAWRTGGAASQDADMAQVVGSILYNGKAGLLDTRLNRRQRVLKADGGPYLRPDYGLLSVEGYPKAGQSLDEVRDLLLAQIEALRAGDFDERLIEATVNNYKVGVMETLRTNEGRADRYVQSFINGMSWAETVGQLDRMARITKRDVVAWVRQNLGADNYVLVYKRQGVDPSEQKIDKPRITPIVMNRDAVSDFVARVQSTQATPIQPQFVDYDKEMSLFRWQPGIEVLYKQNTDDDLFTLTYLFDTGIVHDPALDAAFGYLRYLDTPEQSAEEINAELYDLACSFWLRAGRERSTLTLSGLTEHMGRAMELVKSLITEAQPDEQVLAGLKGNLFQARANAKLSQSGNFQALQKVLLYGTDFVRRTALSDDRLQALTSAELLGKVRELFNNPYRILYYGPQPPEALRNELEAHLTAPAHPQAALPEHVQMQQTPENRVYLAHFDANQLRYMQVSNRGERFDPAHDPAIRLYNEYFGGGMNSIVFQEMREARSLAYTASAGLIEPGYADTHYGYMAYIATQNDKLHDATHAFEQIIEQMPESETAFAIAKEALLARMRTSRTVRDNILWSYIKARDLGLDADRNRAIYEKVQAMTLDDVKAAHAQWVKGRTYAYGILGNTQEIDTTYLATLGPVQILSQEELFGY